MSKNNIDRYLLLDGYNIIFAWEELKNLSLISLEYARKGLIDILTEYKSQIDEKVIIIFDAHNIENNTENIENYNGITVVFTKEKETADTYIEKITNKLIKDSYVRVVTSDYLEQIIIMSRGALRVSVTDFYKEVEISKKYIRENYLNNKAVKNNMLIENLDLDTIMLLEKMRMDKGDN